MQQELEEILGRDVDLVDRKSIEHSHNWIRRKEILGTARSFYVAGSPPTSNNEFLLQPQLSQPQPSMSRDQASLLDIAEFARAVLEFDRGMDRQELESDRIKRSAILYEITTLGEAVKRLSLEFRNQYPGTPWKKIAGMRDLVTHQYDRVDLDIVWDVIQTDIPELLATINPLLPAEED